MLQVLLHFLVVDAFAFEDKVPGGGVFRVQEHITDRAHFNDFTGIHHRHPVADTAHHVHFVGDQYDGQAELAVDVRQQFQHRLGGLRVKGTGGLVAQQDRRAAGQGAGDPHTLLLST